MVKIRHLGRALLGLAALFAFSTGAKAQVTDLSTITDNATYTLTASTRGYLAQYNSETNVFLMGFGGSDSGSKDESLAVSGTNTFALIKSYAYSTDDYSAYYIFNVGKSEFLSINTVSTGMTAWWGSEITSNTLSSTPDQCFRIRSVEDPYTATTNTSGTWFFTTEPVGSSGYCNVLNIGGDGQVTIDTWGPSSITSNSSGALDGGNQFAITATETTLDETTLTTAQNAVINYESGWTAALEKCNTLATQYASSDNETVKTALATLNSTITTYNENNYGSKTYAEKVAAAEALNDAYDTFYTAVAYVWPTVDITNWSDTDNSRIFAVRAIEANRGFWCYDGTNYADHLTTTGKTSAVTAPTLPTEIGETFTCDDALQFVFIKSENTGGIYCYSVGAKKFLVLDTENTDELTGKSVSYGDTPTSTGAFVTPGYTSATADAIYNISTASAYWVAVSNNYTYGIVGYNYNTDGGTNVKLFDTGTTLDAATLASLQEAINTYETEGLPDKGTFIRIQSVSSNAYVYGEVANTNRLATGTDNTSATSIFYYTEDGKLISYGTGRYLYSAAGGNYCTLADAGTDGLTFTFTKSSTTSGACNIAYKGAANPTETRYMYATSDNTYTDVTSSLSTNNDFIVSAVESLPVTIGASGYGTLYTPVALTVGENTVYTGSQSNDNKSVVLSTVSGTIPANTAVLVAGNKDDVKSFAISSEDGTPIDGNILKGQSASIVASTVTNPYTLQTINGESGFAKFTGGELKGFKCYIENPTVATEAATLAISFEDVTGINAIDAATENGAKTVYDLQGRRVQNAARGLYIVNGQKVLVK